MAWSDAARAAALVARRAHAHQRAGNRSRYPGSFDRGAIQKTYRKHLAKQLRNIRRGYGDLHPAHVKATARIAAQSTYHRNALKNR